MVENDFDPALAEYLAESDELIQKISAHLRAIEKGLQTVDVIDSLYRDIHTLKGSSQLFGFKQVGELAHAIETSLDPIRRDQTKVPDSLLETLLKSLDLVDQLLQSIKESKTEKDAKNEIKVLIANLSEKPDQLATVEKIDKQPVQEFSEEAAKDSAPTAVSNEGAEISSSIRVPVSLLDKLMNLMGEMVLVRNQVLQYANQSDNLEFLNLSQRLDVVTSEIQGEVMKTRMQPIGSVLSKFHRVTRDLAKDLNKKIDLQLIGVETELDKTLLEAVKDPIMHIIRNSCDHGIETIEQRRIAGKNIVGTITVRSYHEGGQVIVEISDDGRGLDRNSLVAKAIERGILSVEKAASISDRDAFGLIFAPGLSTASAVTNVSGRGVGMDVVKNNIEGIGGLVEVHSQPGHGTTTRLKIPLTLAIVPAMIVRVAGERFAIPQVKLVELVRVEGGDESTAIETLQGKPVFRLRGNILPLVTLHEVLNMSIPTAKEVSNVTNIVVLNAEGTLLGLIVDEVQDTAEVVVKPLSSFLKSLLLYSGATVLGDGSVALILDIVGIAQRNNLNPEGNGKVKKADVIKDNQMMTETQEFLLFKLNSPTKHAIPLNLVHRLEEFKADEIEYSGQQRFVRYRSSALPVISLNAFLGYPENTQKESVSVIVAQKASKMFGIEVDEIFDVLNTSSQMDDAFSDRAGIFGNLVTDDELIVVVDTLRVLDEVAKQLSNGNSGSPQPSTQEQRATGKVLFAEDTSFFRKHVTTVLERAGYKVTSCENGFDAMQILEKSKISDFDLVLSDIEMPKMNGLEFVKNIRKNTQWKNIPCVALTTKFTSEHVEEGKRAGFTSYMEKLKPDELLAELSLILSNKERKSA